MPSHEYNHRGSKELGLRLIQTMHFLMQIKLIAEQLKFCIIKFKISQLRINNIHTYLYLNFVVNEQLKSFLLHGVFNHNLWGGGRAVINLVF